MECRGICITERACLLSVYGLPCATMIYGLYIYCAYSYLYFFDDELSCLPFSEVALRSAFRQVHQERI